MNQVLPDPCSCAIDCFPPTTSVVNCAEHGMPQNLGDTEYPGTYPRYGLPIHGFGETGYVAPLFDQQQIEEAAQLAKAVGYKVGRPVQMCSLASLRNIAASAGPTNPPSLQYHKPGCIYSTGPHPGDCYVPVAKESQGLQGPGCD